MPGARLQGVRSRILLALGAILILVGVFVAVRPLIADGAPVTGSRLLDMAFAAFFLLRGVMNIRAARRKPPVVPGATPSSPHRRTPS